MQNLTGRIACNTKGPNNSKASGSTETTSEQQPEYFRQLATFASRLLLISSIITNIEKEAKFLIIASIISLYAGLLLVKSAAIEAQVQQIAPGQTTIANRLKLVGTTGNLIFSFILYIVLLIETSIGTPPTVAGQTPVSGTSGALLV
jgi:diacylglycerol kinase